METTDYSYKKIWTITYPVLLSLVMQQMLGITDTAFLGRVGEIELGASALGGIYYLVLYMIANGFGVGAEIVMGRRNGEGNSKAIGQVFFHGVVFAVVLAAVMFLLSNVGAHGMLRSFISSPDVFEASWSYVRWRIYGFFFSFVGIMYRSFYMATTRTKVLTVNSLVMVGCNVVLNYVLIFGKLGLPALGIAGAAIASSLSEMISMVFYIVYTRVSGNNRAYGLFSSLKFSFRTLGEMLKVAGWTMVQFFFSSGTWMFFFMAIEHLGERPLAVSNMVRNMGSVLYLSVSAYATAGTALVTNLMGAGKSGEVMKLCTRIIKMSGLTMLPFVMFVVIFPELSLRLYSDDAGLISAAVPSLLVMMSAMVFAVPAYVYFLAIAGTGNTRAAMLVELVTLVAYGVWIWWLVYVENADVAWCWTSETLYSVILLVLSLVYMKKGRWKEKKI